MLQNSPFQFIKIFQEHINDSKGVKVHGSAIRKNGQIIADQKEQDHDLQCLLEPQTALYEWLKKQNEAWSSQSPILNSSLTLIMLENPPVFLS